MKQELQEEFNYVQAELEKELQSLATAVDPGINNLKRGKLHRLSEVTVLARGERISKLTKRLLVLDKVLKQL